MDITSLKAQARDLERRGRTREALAMYRHALTSLEGTPELLGELPLYVKAGDLYLKLDNPRAAVSLYETAGKIYAAHGSAKSVNAICAKVTGVMPARTHVYTRLLRIMLEHGHAAAARVVLLHYAEHAGLHGTSARLEQIADRTDEHLHPVLEMLVEMAERLERAGAPAEVTARSGPPEVALADDLLTAEITGPPETDEMGTSAEEMGLEEESRDEPAAELEVEVPESEDSESPPPAPSVSGPIGPDAEASDEEEPERDPFGQGLVLSDLASEIMASQPIQLQSGEGVVPGFRDHDTSAATTPSVDAPLQPPWIDFDAPAAGAYSERAGTEEPIVEEEPEQLRIDRTATPIPPEPATTPTPPTAPATVEPEPSEPPAAAGNRDRAHGIGVDWPADPGLPGRAARRHSPVGSVLLAAAEESRHRRRRTPWYVAGAVVVVVAVVAIVWLLTRSGGAEEVGGTAIVADSGRVASDAPPAPGAVMPPGIAGEAAPLTLRLDPALSVESVAVPPPDTTLLGGAAPSGGGVTVVAIAGLAIESVSETRIEGRTGYEVLQTLETGERVAILSLAMTEPLGPGGQGEVRIDAAPDGMRMARLRVGEHEVEVRGIVSETAMRALVVRLAEARTSRG